MSYLTEEAYERKQGYAERIMRENREIDCDLTYEQKLAIEEICAIRHRVHSDPHAAEHMYYCQSAEYDELWQLIGTECEENRLAAITGAAGLPPIDWTCDEADYTTEADVLCGITDEMTDDEITDEILRLGALVENWNAAIETWLKTIDAANGTHYAPTGMSRNI